ncbi:MAG: hypothetical protein EBY22_13635 [Gammaproteobacteria bacterium]|nr:hypothetical protein [Gammaproteobacteria bacterium]
MKVVILSNTDSGGGAAIAARRLNDALINNGVQSHMLVLEKKSANEKVVALSLSPLRKKILKGFTYFEYLFQRKILLKDKTVSMFSTNNVGVDVSQHPLIQNADVIIIDTAGRLHNKVGLMNELAKINRVIQKFKADAPNEIILVIDATTGQNAFEQAKEFTFATKVNALAVTKLDGTAKGGVVIGVSHSQNIPVKYIGIGEQATDLKLFDKYTFIASIFQS